jgi:hypothetical protein
MALRSWAFRLFANPTREFPVGCPPTTESLDDRAPPTITAEPARGKAKKHRGYSAPGEQAPRSLIHTGRFSPEAIGFWLGGAGLGTCGCLLGALMPYCHPAAVAISVLWWGIYLGCLGASVGALVGALTRRAPPRSWATWERAGKPDGVGPGFPCGPGRVHGPALPSGSMRAPRPPAGP